jgi:hypothetical protein
VSAAGVAVAIATPDNEPESGQDSVMTEDKMTQLEHWEDLNQPPPTTVQVVSILTT